MSRKIFIVSPAWLGDLIMSQSLYISLKKLDKNCHITLYAPSYLHTIIKRMPQVDAIYENPFGHGQLRLKDRFIQGRQFAKEHFDEAFILANSIKSALVPFFANIPKRTAFIGENRYILLNNYRTNKEDYPRMVERYVALAYDKTVCKNADFLKDKITYPHLQAQAQESLLSKFNLDPHKKYLAIGCGANYGPAKLWPTQYFAKVCDFWLEQGGAVLLFGSQKDQNIVNEIKSKLVQTSPYFYNIAGLTNLEEALDLLSMCKAAVCNDSGLMHIVAALNIPQVAIFGSTSTKYTPPLSDKALCLESSQNCHPCFKRTCKFDTYACLHELKPLAAINYIKNYI